jgi:hypothetical protein
MSATAQINVNVNTADAQDQVESLSSSFATMGTSINQMGMMGMTSIMGLTIAENSLLNAQNNVSNSTESLQLAIRNYGQNSIQATQAQQSLENAQRSAAMSQAQYNMQLMMMVGMLLPQMVTMLPKLVENLQSVAAQVQMGTADWTAYAAAAGLAISLATLGVGLVVALGSYAAISNATNISNTPTYNLYSQSDVSSMANYNNTQVAAQTAAATGR